MLQQVKVANPEVSYGDIWTLAGSYAVEWTGGPKIGTGIFDFGLVPLDSF
jgi:hypothetical protein